MRALAVVAFAALAATARGQTDQQICEKIFAGARERNLRTQPITAIVETVARQFIGSPYEAKTLDRDSTEHVVTNLRTFDCVTLVENVLALARCIRQNTLTFAAYRGELERLRYRGGTCRGYPSRLHYFSDWIADGEAKGTVRNITATLGGRPARKTIDFISRHRALYPRLGADSTILAVEARLSRAPRTLLGAARAATVPPGAIVAVAAAAGLDISHTGIAVRGEDGLPHLLHAPDVGDTVQISAQPLTRVPGKPLIIALPLDPP